jgi:flavin reductase (DIM6/NTAB) family NADH-FMN oxidoreductase RutF
MSEAPTQATDPNLFRRVMGQFATGVTVLSFMVQQRPVGMTANAFMSVSMNPPLVLTAVRHESRFNSYVQIGVRFGINVLSEQQRSHSVHFAGRRIEDFEPLFVMQGSVPLLEGSLAWIAVRVVASHVAGDHILYIGAVEHMWLGESREPVAFLRWSISLRRNSGPPCAGETRTTKIKPTWIT